MHDDGKYTCTAVNKGGSSAVFTTLQLIGKSILSLLLLLLFVLFIEMHSYF